MTRQLPEDRHIPPLMSVTEAADELDMTPQGVRKAAARGQILGRKVGSTWVFRRVTVERAKAQRTGRLPA
ncbi:helix-turn-helix domain-containing protein [Glycomyces sp. NPDC021274]|uniref:helix-turn-helix domain-containing protein n=1 Tax=Glycomyces sp. NPDC021274 TaxID=3155120 RepID=UPI0033F29BAD